MNRVIGTSAILSSQPGHLIKIFRPKRRRVDHGIGLNDSGEIVQTARCGRPGPFSPVALLADMDKRRDFWLEGHGKVL